MLIGRGALANYHDLPAEAEADFNHWHDREHLPERVAVPGFLRGRRYRSARGSPRYFILYETVDVNVLASSEYRARLDAPTAWTGRVSRRMTRTIRTAARVRASAGRGSGGLLLAVRLRPPPAREAALAAALGQAPLDAVAPGPGVCGAHALEADAGVTGMDTRERALRDPPDEMVPWMLLLEGSDGDALEAAWRSLGATLPEAGAESGLYALQTSFALCDL